jgi:hypothetical protein
MLGENLGKKCFFVSVLVAGIVSLERDTPFVIALRLGNQFVSHLTIHVSIWWVLLDSMFP